MGVIAGPYTSTHGGSAFGFIEDGFDLEFSADSKDLITGDNKGGSVQDGVYRGGQCFIGFTMMEYDLAEVRAMLWPYGVLGELGQVGRLDSNLASALVLTNTAGTPAFGQPTSFTANLAILAENFPVRLLFASRARRMPIRLRLLPFDDAGTTRWFKLVPAQ